MYKIICRLLFVLLFFVSSAVKSQSQSDIEQAVQEIQRRHNLPAVGFVLVRNGKPTIEVVSGVRDVKTNEAVNRFSVFRLGSISKTFAGLATLKAEELGLIELNDKVSDHLGDNFLNNPWVDQSPVRIKHLLEHTAGFFDITSDEFGHDSAIPISLKDAFSLSPESRTVQWQPGIHSSYSNIGAPILAYIIEKASGKTFETFMDTHVLELLGMRQTSFFHDNYTAQHIVSGYSKDGKRAIPYWHIAYRPFGALNTRVDEVSQFLTMLINQGRLNGKQVFSQQQIERLQTPTSSLAAKNNLAYGYGLGVYASQINGFRFYGHGGTAAGHLSDFRYSPELKSGFVVLINANNRQAMSEIKRLLGSYLTQDLVRPAVNRDNRQISDSQLEGIYLVRSDTRNRTLYPFVQLLNLKKLTLRGNYLVLGGGLLSAARRFYPVTKDHYAESPDGMATTSISQFDGQWHIQTPEANYHQVSASVYFVRNAAVYFVLGSLLLILAYAIYWLPRLAMGLIKEHRGVLVRGLPLSGVVLLLSPFILEVTRVNLGSFGGYTSYLFIGMTLLSIIAVVRCKAWPVSIFSKGQLVLSTISHSLVAGFLFYWGMV